MDWLDIIGLCGATGLLMSLADTKKFKEKRSRWPFFAKAWHHFKVVNLCIFATYLAGALTSGFLVEYIFKDQNPYVFSGSPVTVLSFGFWGIIAIWIASGAERSDEEVDSGLSTSEGRLAWIIQQPIYAAAALVKPLVKPALWLFAAALAVIVIVLIYLIGEQIEQKLEAMSPAQAIILAGIIIAAAIMAVGRNRQS